MRQVRPRIGDKRVTKKGKQWYFGMKVHIGGDVNCGAVHTVEVTAANEADINVFPKKLFVNSEFCR